MRLYLLPLVLTLVAAEEINYFMKVYEDCQKSEGLLPCLKKKAIIFFDRASRMEKIPLVDGVDVVKSTNVNTMPLSENEIDVELPRNIQDKDQALTQMLWDRIATFANSRTVQLSLPKISGEELNKGVEEGRGKMKKMMGMMMMGAAMKMVGMMPLAIAGLFVLAGKALITAKIALLLAGIIALKKLMSQKGGSGGGGGGGGGGHHESHGWSSGGGGGGYDRRAYIDASDMAYSAYRNQ